MLEVMGLKGYRLWVMGQGESTCSAPPRLQQASLTRVLRVFVAPLALAHHVHHRAVVHSWQAGQRAVQLRVLARKRRRARPRGVRLLVNVAPLCSAAGRI
jgi:hypothetical protein